MSTSLPKWKEKIRNAGSTEACLREAIRQIKGLNDMRPHDGLGYEINDVIEVANSIKGKNGNAAAMREALTNIAEYAKCAQCHTKDNHVLGYLDQIENWCRAALSEPPRNCDIYPTNEDAWRSYQLSHAKNADAYVEETVPDFIDWLFALAEKGGRDA